jgi:cytochrome c oxidase subunit I
MKPDRGWNHLNFIISIGGNDPGIAVLIFAWNLVRVVFPRTEGGERSWDAWTLEWSTPSPPPPYNFATDPVVRSRRPLWDLKHPDDPDWKYEA